MTTPLITNGLKEKQFKTLAEKTSEGLMLLNRNLQIIYTNPAVEYMVGFGFEDMKDFNTIDFLPPEELKNTERLLRKSNDKPGKPLKGQLLAKHKDGRSIWIEGIVTNMLDEDEVNAFVLNFRDITERKETERKIDELNQGLEEKVLARTAALEAANQELEAFTYSVSHDLRAPLRAVNGYAKLLEEDYAGVLDKEGKEFIEIIRRNAANMGQLIDDLLEFSKVGRKTPEPRCIDMAEMVAAILEEIRMSTPHRAHIEIGHLPRASSDPVLMHQVLFNLISNAVKYSSKKDDPKVTISAEETENEFIFCIKDNGAGFDMRHAAKLFGVFNRLHNNSEFEGVGVGLAIVRRIIDKFGGRVWAEGKVNEGAVFYFTVNK